MLTTGQNKYPENYIRSQIVLSLLQPSTLTRKMNNECYHLKSDITLVGTQLFITKYPNVGINKMNKPP